MRLCTLGRGANALNPNHSDNRRVPIYEYRCAACSKRSSALLASYSTPDPKCPHCGKLKLKRLVSTFATARGEDSGESENEFGGDSDFGGGDGGGDDGGFDDY